MGGTGAAAAGVALTIAQAMFPAAVGPQQSLEVNPQFQNLSDLAVLMSQNDAGTGFQNFDVLLTRPDSYDYSSEAAQAGGTQEFERLAQRFGIPTDTTRTYFAQVLSGAVVAPGTEFPQGQVLSAGTRIVISNFRTVDLGGNSYGIADLDAVANADGSLTRYANSQVYVWDSASHDSPTGQAHVALLARYDPFFAGYGTGRNGQISPLVGYGEFADGNPLGSLTGIYGYAQMLNGTAPAETVRIATVGSPTLHPTARISFLANVDSDGASVWDWSGNNIGQLPAGEELGCVFRLSFQPGGPPDRYLCIPKSAPNAIVLIEANQLQRVVPLAPEGVSAAETYFGLTGRLAAQIALPAQPALSCPATTVYSDNAYSSVIACDPARAPGHYVTDEFLNGASPERLGTLYTRIRNMRIESDNAMNALLQAEGVAPIPAVPDWQSTRHVSRAIVDYYNSTYEANLRYPTIIDVPFPVQGKFEETIDGTIFVYNDRTETVPHEVIHALLWQITNDAAYSERTHGAESIVEFLSWELALGAGDALIERYYAAPVGQRNVQDLQTGAWLRHYALEHLDVGLGWALTYGYSEVQRNSGQAPTTQLDWGTVIYEVGPGYLAANVATRAANPACLVTDGCVSQFSRNGEIYVPKLEQLLSQTAP